MSGFPIFHSLKSFHFFTWEYQFYPIWLFRTKRNTYHFLIWHLENILITLIFPFQPSKPLTEWKIEKLEHSWIRHPIFFIFSAFSHLLMSQFPLHCFFTVVQNSKSWGIRLHVSWEEGWLLLWFLNMSFIMTTQSFFYSQKTSNQIGSIWKE